MLELQSLNEIALFLFYKAGCLFTQNSLEGWDIFLLILSFLLQRKKMVQICEESLKYFTVRSLTRPSLAVLLTKCLRNF